MLLCLIPNVLGSIDMVALIGEEHGVVDPQVYERVNIEHIIALKAVGIDDSVGDR